MRSTGKWVSGVNASTPVAEAARLILTDRLAPLPRLLKRAAAVPTSDASDDIRRVHQLRVATRRAAAAVQAFEDVLPNRTCRRTLSLLRLIRRAAGKVRDCDVLISKLQSDYGSRRTPAAAAARNLADQLIANRALAIPELSRVSGKLADRRFGTRTRKLLEGIDPAGIAEITAGALARRMVRRGVDRLREAVQQDLNVAEHLHRVRIAVKRLRYLMELFGCCFGESFRRQAYAAVLAIQDQLGEFNDLATFAAALHVTDEPKELEKPVPSPTKGTRRISLERLQAGRAELSHVAAENLAAAHSAAIAALAAFDPDRFAAELEAAIRPVVVMVGQIEPKSRIHPTGDDALNGHAADPHERSERIAAIDIGTNSLRLIIAEVTSDGRYRVLDDEKEVTRLGRGLHETRRLDPEAIAHSVAAVVRMKSIASGYGVTRLRVVATAAAREAENGGDLVHAIAREAELEVEVISAEQEAMLAHRSAARTFDLRSICAAVLDIGGGSTEVVLSVPRAESSAESAEPIRIGNPIIERVYTIPLGAVRLTERFGGPENCCGDRFAEMRRFVKSVVRQHVGRPPAWPQLMIGTGGTLTALGAMSLHRNFSSADSSLFAGVVQGHDVPRADLRHVIDSLRKMPAKERARVAGLSPDRADIIVPGLVILDILLRRFDANRVRVHEGGIRDGMLLSMIRPVRPAADFAAIDEDPISAVRRFARSCAYEEPHSLHVARLACQIFDQLVAISEEEGTEGRVWFGADATRARQLLEAASILHDVGYLINYAAHHKHSYHLIVHADLPGWSAREVQIIAHVARYHRCGPPKRKHRAFGSLDRADRRLVRELAGILRIADGFDRTHTQRARSVALQSERGLIRFAIDAIDQPEVDMWGAARKSGLFRRAFKRDVEFDWRNAQRVPETVEGSAKSSLISV